MKTFKTALLACIALISHVSAYSQYYHKTYTDNSYIGNGALTMFPYFNFSNYGSVMGGVSTTWQDSISSELSPMMICTYPNSNAYFNYTYLWKNCCVPIVATSSKVIQLGYGTGFGLVSSFLAPYDGCKMYTNTHSGIPQAGYKAGGVLYQATSFNGPSVLRYAWVPMQNNIPTWDVYDIEITDVARAVNQTSGKWEIFFTGNYRYGQEVRVMFAFKIEGNTGAVIWHKQYAIGHTFNQPTARGIIHSPYDPNELYIVGDVDKIRQDDVSTHNAFIMKINANNGNAITSNIYDRGNIESFHDITVSDDPQNPGFAICGYTGINYVNSGKFWVLKMDQYMNMQWSKSYTDVGNSFDITEANSIIGRYSDANNRYEYYVAGRKGQFGSQDAMVLKLDQDGFPINGGATGGIFVYHTDNEYAVSIDQNSEPGAWGEGLGIYCYHDDGNVTNTYAIHAYFNGISGCNETFYDADATEEPVEPLNTYAAFADQWMPFDMKYKGLITNAENEICYTAYDASGSNAKPTGVSNMSQGSRYAIEITPNPATTYINVNFAGNANYTISNSMGQVMCSGSIKTGTERVDIQQFAAGVYFVNITENGIAWHKKFVKQ